MGVYKYDAINDELIPIAGVPSVPGIEDKVSTYTADATYWDTSPTAASTKPVTSGGIKTEIDKKLSTYAIDSTAWDAAPTTGSTKPVISDGIKTQFDLVHNELSDVNNILGSKNILPNSATTQVINGITYTVAADGSINVNGTASADSILHIVPGTTGKLSNIFSKGGNYIISVGTTGTGVNVFFGIEYTGSTWDIAEWLTYSTRLSKEIYIDGTKLNNSSSYIESYIKVNSGTTVSNIKVYPMLRPSSVRDDTYVPYSKTNYELTTEISNFTKVPNYSTNGDLKYRKIGALVELSCRVDSKLDGYTLGTLPAGYRPTDYILLASDNAPSQGRAQINPTTGTVTWQNTTGSGINVRIHAMYYATN